MAIIDTSKITIPTGFFEDLNVPKLFKWLYEQPTADVVSMDEIRRIFEEIEKKIEDTMEVQSRIYYGGKRSSEELCVYISKISALREIEIFIENLKEKYLKGE